MKKLTRAFVLVLTLTGAAAAYSNVTSSHTPDGVTASKASAFPIPTCPPNDPNACGMGGPNPTVVETR